MNDSISKQAAIDAVSRGCQEFRGIFAECEKNLNELPPVQPEPSTEIQEILDYLDTTLHPIVSPNNWNVYAELHDMVSMLPSVQPEIIYCKDCKHYNVGFECLIEGYGIERNKNWYCADAERRTDG